MHISGYDLSKLDHEELAQRVRKAAYQIIEGKKATYFGVAQCITHIVECVFEDKQEVLPLSVMANGEYGVSDVCISVPCTLGENGPTIKEVRLDDAEYEHLKASAEVIRKLL